MLQHVALEVADPEPDVAFWALLGFERIEPPPGLRDRAVWVQRDGQQVHLFLSDEPVVPPQGHTAIVAADYAGQTAALRAAGHDVQDRAPHWGAARCFARAPSGHRVEIMEAPPG